MRKTVARPAAGPQRSLAADGGSNPDPPEPSGVPGANMATDPAPDAKAPATDPAPDAKAPVTDPAPDAKAPAASVRPAMTPYANAVALFAAFVVGGVLALAVPLWVVVLVGLAVGAVVFIFLDRYPRLPGHGWTRRT
jgi:hypothetical protein